jgi:chromate transporter
VTDASIRQSGDITAPERISLSSLFVKFIGFGLLAFGGPVAQIAMLRQTLVEEEKWIDQARFNRLLAVLQVLPGPEAHELCVHMGMIARGRLGGVLAGLGFMLPGFLLMVAAGWAYVTWIAGSSVWSGILLGVQIAVLAVILRSVIRIGQHIIIDRLLGLVAAASLAATLTGVPFWIPLLAGGLAYAFAHRPILVMLVVVCAAGLSWLCTFVAIAGGSTLAAPATASAATLFLAGLKGGLLTFGGAYTAIPYVRADTVSRGWINDATFLDGIAIAGILPAPLVIFATFVGYISGGLPGALAITAGMFLPAFAFSLVLFERLEAIIEHPALQRVLEGVAAAVVGVIAATFIHLTQATAANVPSPARAIAIFAVALLAAWRSKGAWVTPVILLFGAGLGWSFLTA